MLSRRQRRQLARETGEPFAPIYNSGIRFDRHGNEIKVGGEPRTYEETYGKGYERFNGKFVTICEGEIDGD